MRKAAFFVLVLLAGCEQSPKPIQVNPLGEFTGKIIKVIDGDTIDVLHGDKITTRVRLNGIDAPESSQPISAKSKEHLSELIGEQLLHYVPRMVGSFSSTLNSQLATTSISGIAGTAINAPVMI